MHRISELERLVKELESTIDDRDERCIARADRLYALEEELRSIKQWKNGNGAMGAEARIQEVEKSIMKIRETIDGTPQDAIIARAANAAVHAVIDNARMRDRTAVSRMKAAAPYFAAICSLIGVIVMALLR